MAQLQVVKRVEGCNFIFNSIHYLSLKDYVILDGSSYKEVLITKIPSELRDPREYIVHCRFAACMYWSLFIAPKPGRQCQSVNVSEPFVLKHF